MATTKQASLTSLKNRSAKQIATDEKMKPSGLYGLYKGQMTLNGTSNEVFNLEL